MKLNFEPWASKTPKYYIKNKNQALEWALTHGIKSWRHVKSPDEKSPTAGKT